MLNWPVVYDDDDDFFFFLAHFSNDIRNKKLKCML